MNVVGMIRAAAILVDDNGYATTILAALNAEP